jgi:hypothetical protein
MPSSRISLAALVAHLALALALPVGAGAANRIPVSSIDDSTSSTANRIAAVTNIVVASNARVDRVALAWPPNPCAGITEPSSLCTAALGVVGAYSALGQAVADACAGIPLTGPGDAVISDADIYAADTTAAGIANQLASIRTVLGDAGDRLGGITIPDPGPPDGPEAAALDALSVAIFEGGTDALDLVGGGGFDYPPNPCSPVDG